MARPSLASCSRLLCIVAFSTALAGCPPKFPKCEDDTNCASHGMVCLNNTCVQCRDDGQCKPGFECKDNACVEKPECNSNEDCPTGICKQHKCVPQCKSDYNCAMNQKCQDKRCVARPECDDSHPCPDGKICQDEKCVEAPKGESQTGVTLPTAESDCSLTTIYFPFNEFGLTEEARNQVDRNAECIKKRGHAVTVEGNADERGTEEYNITLANKRADSVRKYLVGLGLTEKQVFIVSYGKERPVDNGHDEAAWAKNRRADFVWR